MKALIVIFDGFQPKELYPIKDILSKHMEVSVLSLHKDPVGMDGKPYKPDMYLDGIDINRIADEYDIVVFIGGAGVYRRIVGEIKDGSLEKAIEIARKFYERGKLVCAICASPAILALAGINKRMTVWPSEDLIRIIRERASYSERDVEVDDNVITANGPGAAEKFAKEILRVAGISV